MREMRSRLLVTLVLLLLATVCAWNDVRAGALVAPSNGAAVSGSTCQKPGADAFAGDPDSQGGKEPPPPPISLNTSLSFVDDETGRLPAAAWWQTGVLLLRIWGLAI